VPLDELTAEEREIVESVLEAFRLFNELRLDPTNDELYEAALAARVDPARAAAQQIIEGYRSDGLRSRPFPGLPASITPFLDTLTIGDDGADASVDVCWLNSNILVEVGTGEDGGDRVVNDVISSQYMRYEVQRSDGRWLLKNILGGDVFEGATTCN
jgi:hypothetical protein